jgi:hypothetical protein
MHAASPDPILLIVVNIELPKSVLPAMRTSQLPLPRHRVLWLIVRKQAIDCGVLGLLLAQGLAFVITQALKNACGKPRPDLIDRSQSLSFQRCGPLSFRFPDTASCGLLCENRPSMNKVSASLEGQTLGAQLRCFGSFAGSGSRFCHYPGAEVRFPDTASCGLLCENRPSMNKV